MGVRGGAPIDRGYAWVIVAGAFLNLVIVLGVAKSMGIIFVALHEYYNRSATATAVFYPLMAGCSLFMAPVITALTEVFSIRVVCMTGSCLITLGTCISFAGTSLEGIIFPYGIIGGFGVGMLLNPAPLILSHYFKKRIAFATGILFAGTGVGGIIGPFVITFLLDNFGLHGSFLLIGALSFHTLVFAALYLPISYWGPAGSPEAAAPVVAATSVPLVEGGEEDAGSDCGEEALEPLHVSALSLSNLDLPTILLESKGLPTILEAGERLSLVKRLLHKRSETGELVPILRMAVLREPVFVLFSAGCLCGMSGFYWGMLTPAFCEEDLGMSRRDTSLLLSLMGVGDLCGRLLMAATGDNILVRCRPATVGLALMLISVCVVVCPFFPSFWSHGALLVVGQLGFGCFVALSPVALGDLVPKDALSSAWGFLLFFEGVGHICTPLLIGVIKDAKGTYFGGYFLVASFLFLGGLLVSAAAALHKLQAPTHRPHDRHPP